MHQPKKPRQKGRIYACGTEIPDEAQLEAFNAGYYLGIKLIGREIDSDYNNLKASFLNGILQGVMYRFKCTIPKAARLLKITPKKAHKVMKMEDTL